jgi:hypothetical protein
MKASETFENARIIKFDICVNGGPKKGPEIDEERTEYYDWALTITFKTEKSEITTILPLVTCNYDNDHGYYEQGTGSTMIDFANLMASCGVANLFSLRDQIVRLRSASSTEIEVAPVIGGRWYKLKLVTDKK